MKGQWIYLFILSILIALNQIVNQKFILITFVLGLYLLTRLNLRHWIVVIILAFILSMYQTKIPVIKQSESGEVIECAEYYFLLQTPEQTIQIFSQEAIPLFSHITVELRKPRVIWQPSNLLVPDHQKRLRGKRF